MRRLPRRLLLWGGAAAVASGGFAFMNSNAVPATSAGDGAGSVTGYTVSTIVYTPVPGNPKTTEDLLYVTFKLTGLNKPSQVVMQPLHTTTPIGWRTYTKNHTMWKTDGFPLGLRSGWGNIQHQFGMTLGKYTKAGCTTTSSWTTTTNTGNTLGYETVECQYTAPYVATAHAGPKMATITSLDIEANQ